MSGDSRKAFFFPRKRIRTRTELHSAIVSLFPARNSAVMSAMSASLGLRRDRIRVKIQQLRMVKLKSVHLADDTAELLWNHLPLISLLSEMINARIT